MNKPFLAPYIGKIPYCIDMKKPISLRYNNKRPKYFLIIEIIEYR